MATSNDGGQYVFKRVEAQRSSTRLQWCAVLGAGLCIALAARLQEPINHQRKELQLVMQSDLYRELPPKYAWMSAVGTSFRGIAADVLWMRAERLKQEGKYFESHQLAKWICTLQPRFAAVWAHQAWNMAYNISVGTYTPQERWQWIYNGIRLLRDEGIPNNQRAAGLYYQLAWTWFHKVGHRMDDFHWYFKREWAATMEILLGAPPTELSDAETIDWFRPVAEAPLQFEALVEAYPQVTLFVDQLDGLGIDINATTDSQRIFHPLEESFFRKYTAYQQTQQSSRIRAKPEELSAEDQKLYAFFAQAPADEFNALLAFLRSKVLREQYKMDPQYMLELTGRLGSDTPLPIDWRTPWSQALYWATYGNDMIQDNLNLDIPDTLQSDRVRLFCLADLSKMGRYAFQLNLTDTMKSYLALTPDLRYIEAMHQTYLEFGKKYAEEGEDVGETAGERLRSGHVTNLHDTIVALYQAGREKEARKYYEYLAVNYKEMFTGRTQPKYLQDLDSFIRGQLADMAGQFGESRMLIHQYMNSAYTSLAIGYANEFSAKVRNAELVWKIFQQRQMDEPQGRQALPPFPQMRATALANFMLNPRLPLVMRSSVWGRERDAVKLRCYDVIRGPLSTRCEQSGLDVDKAFPAPAGLEQWRKKHPKLEQPEDTVKKKDQKDKGPSPL